MNVRMKRVYEAADRADGYRVLVDRLWPRGLAKAKARIDLWCRDAAPSAELRKRWHATPDRESQEHFEAFCADYRAELSREPASAALDELASLARAHGALTLLYAAKNERMNHAVVLRDALLEKMNG